MARKSGLGSGNQADVFELRDLEMANARAVAFAGTAVVADIPTAVGAPVFRGADDVHPTFPAMIQVDSIATDETCKITFVFRGNHFFHTKRATVSFCHFPLPLFLRLFRRVFV